MSLYAVTVDSIQALLYTGITSLSITGLTHIDAFTLAPADDPFDVAIGARECQHGGFIVITSAGSLSTMPASASDPYSVQWMMDYSIRIRVGVDITGRSEAGRVDLIAIYRQLANAMLTTLQPADGTPRNVTRWGWREPIRSTLNRAITVLEIQATLKEPWGRV